MARRSVAVLVCVLVAWGALAQDANVPAFEAATIKLPPVTNTPSLQNAIGFYGLPGGRVFYGGTVKMLVEYAFDLRSFQVTGGDEWVNTKRFAINAVPPENSPTRKSLIRTAEPSAEQRMMLQSLLRERFGLKYHRETREGEVYILSRGDKPLVLKTPKDAAADPRAIVIHRPDGIDGEALGINTTMDYFALRMSQYLKLPVQNETGITGAYDFDLPGNDPGNEDEVAAVINVVNRLGLKLKRGRGPVETLVIDHVDQPTEN